jgi:hypothetical protein
MARCAAEEAVYHRGLTNRQIQFDSRRCSGRGGDDAGGSLDGGGAAVRDDGGFVSRGVGVGPVRPGQADSEEDDQQVYRLPGTVDVAAGLGGFDRSDGLGGDGFAVGAGFVEAEAFQLASSIESGISPRPDASRTASTPRGATARTRSRRPSP